MKTAIKICGLTNTDSLDAVVQAGADAVGFVFYPKSKRYITPTAARELVYRLPPFVQSVGLFVNAEPGEIEAILHEVPLSLLQFHGDETPEECERYDRPYIKAIRMNASTDLNEMAKYYASARALLLDTDSSSFGGTGTVFDWSMITENCAKPFILAGGLTPENVRLAIRQVKPAAVDVSSGVERLPGVKCHQKVTEFVAAVRQEES